MDVFYWSGISEDAQVYRHMVILFILAPSWSYIHEFAEISGNCYKIQPVDWAARTCSRHDERLSRQLGLKEG